MAIREGQGLGRMTLALGGGSLALFWIMVIPFNSFAGATTVLDPLQLAAQGFHLACCPLLAIGAATFVWPRGLLRGGAVDPILAGVMAGGAVLMNLPPIPGFHLVQVAGGVILGGSFVAVALRTGESRDETAVMPGARPD